MCGQNCLQKGHAYHDVALLVKKYSNIVSKFAMMTLPSCNKT